MNNLVLWMILGRDLQALDAMNSLGLWMTWKSLSREINALDDINNSE